MCPSDSYELLLLDVAKRSRAKRVRMPCVDADDLFVTDGAGADADSVEEDGADEEGEKGLVTISRWKDRDRRSIAGGGP